MIDFLSINVTNVILTVLLITVLIIFLLYLYTDNKKLKEQLEDLRKENRSLLEKKIMKQENVDSISIQKISTVKNNLENNENLNMKINTEELTLQQEKTNLQEPEKNNKYIYNNPNENQQKNNFDLNDLINKNDYIKISRPEPISHYDYLEEIQAKMAEELKPQTIELTDYEKKQEEQAVISYKELLRFKDNNQYNDEKQETIKFIEELKNLRNSLK